MWFVSYRRSSVPGLGNPGTGILYLRELTASSFPATEIMANIEQDDESGSKATMRVSM